MQKTWPESIWSGYIITDAQLHYSTAAISVRIYKTGSAVIQR